ncbi:NAD-dependent epimerase/dehydratase family protein [Acidimangrovimonas pyrenivorans]|uniref:NAD-dependent epimerase/dehydratase family protein n=1 Tax=Acidimangrovimonas pyrenivorans TaxID=2030798 RepID=A0ABV7AJV0_9RHOB
MTDQGRIVLTGASGYIAKHVLLKLLAAGYRVTATLRSPARADEVRAAVAPHLADAAAQERLDFATLDLTRDDGWAATMAGAEALVHTASPFPLGQPRDEDALIRPAVDGTRRALAAAHAAGIGRVVLTSSSAAIMAGKSDVGRPWTEEDWSDLDHPSATAYVKSKTLAERAAWDFVKKEAPGIGLTVINPVVVIGAPLDARFGSSVGIVQRLLAGKDPMVPRMGFPLVDVRDVAEMHLRAVARPETAGRRFIASDRSMWFAEISSLLRQEFPGRRIPRRVAPDWLMKLLGKFDPAIRSILPSLGHVDWVSNARAREVMGMRFRNTADSLRETGHFLIDSGAVK